MLLLFIHLLSAHIQKIPFLISYKQKSCTKHMLEFYCYTCIELHTKKKKKGTAIGFKAISRIPNKNDKTRKLMGIEEKGCKYHTITRFPEF